MSITPLIRRAETQDGAALLALIHALARFEKLAGPDGAAEARLLQDAFGERPRFEAWLVFVKDQPDPVGYAIVFETYSTFLAKPSLYLEDLFVREEWRGRGFGRALLDHCISLAAQRGCGRLEWTCLDWNVKAQRVYEERGARKMKEWLLYRMTDFPPRATT